MAYDPELAETLRGVIVQFPVKEGETITETKMFGGLCFTLNGKMLIGIDKSRLVVRLSGEDYDRESVAGRALPMDITGRPMRNFAFLPKESWNTEAELLQWIKMSASYVREHMFDKPKKKMR